ncbi:MAG: YdeI/OmpD-associated family protein [Gammaproteobacteria bacterium]|nr:YdeI/OmpD-associated family protein [Gammaproteobacteria bacterium]
MNPNVDKFLAEGCGRCSLWKTPECKVNTWQAELVVLRNILLDSGLNEEVKWSQPCYTLDKKNIILLSAFKDYCALNFFKGSLLKDTHKLLVKPGENSQAARQLRFTNKKDITKSKAIIKDYIQQAISIEKAGKRVEFKKEAEPIPTELKQTFKQHPDFKHAFESLTPGRQRGYILYFSAAKQSQTRTNRIEKLIPKIMQGKGLNE